MTGQQERNHSFQEATLGVLIRIKATIPIPFLLMLGKKLTEKPQ